MVSFQHHKKGLSNLDNPFLLELKSVPSNKKTKLTSWAYHF